MIGIGYYWGSEITSYVIVLGVKALANLAYLNINLVTFSYLLIYI